jgi:2-(3-amino-3-carboxypropyl)histidine synthase
MKTATFDLEEKRLKEEIRKKKAKRVLIQLPEGLKPYGSYLASTVEKAGALAIISADPCYGACDLAIPEAESLDVDLIIHYGHSKMTEEEQKVKTLYIEAKAKSNVKDAVRKALPLLKKWKKIGLVTTVQHVHALNEARQELLKTGKTVAIGDAGHLKYAGQVTGCDLSNAKAVAKEVDAFLFVGGGRFHPIGVALATGKPTVLADPYEKTASTVEGEVNKIFKQRWAQICLAREAEKFGVLVGLKSGQRKLEKAIRVKQKLEETGKQAILLALREITPEALLQFPDIEAFVNTACPRVSLDDAPRFSRPIITFSETLVVLGEMNWEDLCRRGWFENLT